MRTTLIYRRELAGENDRHQEQEVISIMPSKAGPCYFE
jgi:hypothetical protein